MKPMHTDRDHPALSIPDLAAQIAKYTDMLPVECAVAAYAYSKLAKRLDAVNKWEGNRLVTSSAAVLKRDKIRQNASFITERIQAALKSPRTTFEVEWKTDGRYGCAKFTFRVDGVLVFPAVNL